MKYPPTYAIFLKFFLKCFIFKKYTYLCILKNIVPTLKINHHGNPFFYHSHKFFRPMKKIFTLIALVALASCGLRASTPLTDNITSPNSPLQTLQQQSFASQSSIFASSTQILKNEIAGNPYDLDAFNGFNARRKSKAGPVLLGVGAGCIAVGGTLLGIGISKFVKKANEDKEIDELIRTNPIAGTEAMANQQEETPGQVFGRIAMVGGGFLLVATGIPLTIVGAKLSSGNKRGRGHRRHSELIDTRYPSTTLTFSPTPTSAALTLAW